MAEFVQPKVPGSESAAAKAYTAVLYFHGMGDQRRYEELSRLVDALDRYSHLNQSSTGRLGQIRARLEPSRCRTERGSVGYVRVVWSQGRHGAEGRRTFRFYETYWAPLTAGATTAREVALWLLRAVANPVRALATPWRLRPRLRRSVLLGLCSPAWDAAASGSDPGDLKRLLRLYDAFEGPEARRRFQKGSFSEFERFVAVESRGETQAKRVLGLARRWHRAYIRSELVHLGALLTLVLALVLVLIGLASLVAAAIQLLNSGNVPSVLKSVGVPTLEANVWTLSSGVITVLSALGAKRFLEGALGDVQLWSTYEETSTKFARRRAILDEGVAMLEHVLVDPLCERVVVVAHSLGTTIAFDTLLEAARHNRARDLKNPMGAELPLGKLDHLVTLGSPIDKVHYFFESSRSRYHRYNRVVEEVRGDLGSEPFSVNWKPYVHWINFWDRGDPVSGSLETPCSGDPSGTHVRVDNVEVSSFAFPHPVGSHSGYFDHSGVLGTLFSVIFHGDHSFRKAPRDPDGRPDFGAVLCGPGKGSRLAKAFLPAVVALPWLLAAHLLARNLDAGSRASDATGYAALLVALGLGLAWAGSSLLGHRNAA